MSSFTCPSSPERRVTIAGSTSRFGRTAVFSENGVNSSPKQRASDDELLDLGRALVNAKRPNFSVEPLDHARADAETSMELHRRVDDLLRGLRCLHLCHRDLDRGFFATILELSRPINEKARSCESRRHLRHLRLRHLKLGELLSE